MRIGIVCSGIEHVRRGFESASAELFRALRGNVDVALFKGSGIPAADEVIVPCVRRDRMSHLCGSERAYYWEQVTFATSLFPFLIRKKCDVVHYSDGVVGNVLWRLRKATGARFRLILCNSAPFRPSCFRREVHIHQVSPEHYKVAAEYDIPTSRMSLIPYGINPEPFRSASKGAAMRLRYNVPTESIVVLSLAALSKGHKRIDYLIREVASLCDDRFFLCAAGQSTNETPELQHLANKLLPGRHCFLTLAPQQIPSLLGCADIFVLTSLSEGFGMVLIEALAASIPVIAHNSEHFRWLLGNAGILTDMRKTGAAASAMRRVYEDRELALSMAALGPVRVEAHFSWNALLSEYLAMYRRAYESCPA